MLVTIDGINLFLVFYFNLVSTSMQKILMAGHHYTQQFIGDRMMPVKC